MITFSVPLFPPTVNHAYFTRLVKKGGTSVPIRTLSKEGRAFKREFKTHLAKHHPETLNFFLKDKEYEILAVLYFAKVYNAGWPKAAKSRHNKIDVTNRIKVLEDALVDTFSYDDSQHMSFTAVKREAPKGSDEYVEFYAWNLEEDDGPIENFIIRTRLG